MADVNLLAVAAATFVAAFLGGVWYSPALFAKAWMKANRYTPEKMEAMKKARSPAVSILVSIFCNLVLAVVMAVLAEWLGIADWRGGLQLGLLVGLGVAAPLGLMTNMFSDRTPMAFAIDAGYHVLFLALMGAILGYWR